jgi:Tfp pilus assembly protein PilF
MRVVVFGAVCALVIGIYYESAESGFFESASPRAEDSYYNLLVKGFRSGQLNAKREAPPELAKLANPYDPIANASYVWDVRSFCYEMSYYKGKLYLYYGVTPALVLFWPYAVLTGHYCSHKNAVVIFFALGFLTAAGLFCAIWQRYFAEVSIWAVAAGTLALGLVTGALGILSSCDLHEVPHSCGFAFTMLALAAVWNALHKPQRQVLWLMLASLAYGLAIGSRPSLLFGIIILLIPIVHAWFTATEPVSLQRIGRLLMAAVIPAMLIGSGLIIYNVLRFDSPFEFGWRYQLTDIQNDTAQPFSLHYLWFNLKLYFLEPIRWSSHFPFLQADNLSHLPSHYYSVGEPYCGVLCNYPLVWLALAAPLAWRSKSVSEGSALGWFVWAVFLLFVACALTLCCFFSGSSGYLSDFLPALILLSVVGILGLERALADSPLWRRTARWSWCLLLTYSVAFGVLAGVKTHAQANYILGNSFSHQGRDDEAFDHFQKAVTLDPDSAAFRISLGRACAKKGKLDEAILHLQKALEIEPVNVEAQYDIGLSFIQAGKLDEASIHFQKALKIKPDFAEIGDSAENNNFAWSLATNPESRNRNGTVAVILAEAACRKTHYQQTIFVGTLAAAYAEAGGFDDAITTAQKACSLASQSGDQKLLQKNQELLALYLKHQPYHASQANVRK